MMKALFFYLLIAIFTLSSCRQERVIQKPAEKTLFKKDVQNTSTPISGVNQNTSGTSANRNTNSNNLLTELKEKSIPNQLPNDQFPDWESFNNFYEAQKKNLSPQAQQYCSMLILKSFDLVSKFKDDKKEIRMLIVDHLQNLANNKYNGYELLYNYLSWMKSNDLSEYISIKNNIVSYAKPVLGEPDKSKSNSKEIEDNPEFKKEMEAILVRLKRNDSFLEKIKSL